MWQRMLLLLLVYSGSHVNCQNETCGSPNPCPGGSVCTTNGKEYVCHCPDSFHADYVNCQVYSNACNNSCIPTDLCFGEIRPGNSYKCYCSGNIEQDCEDMYCSADSCRVGYLCRNHTDFDGDPSVQCYCPEGYIGYNCEIFNACYEEPCPDNSTCTWYRNPDRYTCSCPEDYLGETCTDGNTCIMNPCSDGEMCTLYSNPDRYTCIPCPAGYTGVDCTTRDVNLCDNSECRGNGICVLTDNKKKVCYYENQSVYSVLFMVSAFINIVTATFFIYKRITRYIEKKKNKNRTHNNSMKDFNLNDSINTPSTSKPSTEIK